MIRVPCGTILYEIKKDEENETKDFIADLGYNLKSYLVAQGGSNGKGNKRNPSMPE